MSVFICSFFEFGTVSKWCIREWVKLHNTKIKSAKKLNWLKTSEDIPVRFVSGLEANLAIDGGLITGYPIRNNTLEKNTKFTFR